MKQKKFFDSYVEYRSPVHGENNHRNRDNDDRDDDGDDGELPVRATNGGARGLPRGDEAALARYDENFAEATQSERDDEDESRARKPDGVRRFLDLLWRRRFLVGPIFLGAIALGLLYALTAPRVYDGTATLLVNTAPLNGARPDPNANPDDKKPSDVPGVDEARNLETQLEIVKTEGVFDDAVARLPQASQDAVTSYFNLDVGSIRNTDLITVTVRTHDPKISVALANSICASYIDQSQKNNRRQIEAAALSAQNQLKTVRANLALARNTLRDFQIQNGITDGQEQAKNVSATLESLKSELRAAQTERAAAGATLQVQQQVLATTQREIVTTVTTTRPAVLALRDQLSKLQIQRIAARAEYAETSDIVVQLDSQIARVQTQLAREPVTETAPAQRTPNPAYLNANEAVGKARSEVEALDARIPVLRDALASATTAQAQFPAKTARLSLLNSNLSTLQNTYDTLNQKVQTLQLSAASQLANGIVTSPATMPDAPSGPSRVRALLAAILGGALLAYAAAMLTERLDEKIHAPAQAERAAQLPILIDVPLIRKRAQQCILTGNAPLLRENFEMLAAQLSLAARHAPLRSVLMTSALPGEGKSVSSVNLAVAAAWAGERVILVDCDLRRPTLHDFFGLSNARGLSDVIMGVTPLEEALQPTKIPGLSVLTAGSPHDSPLELLRSRNARAILDDLHENADLTIVDSPPVLIIADAAILATMTDTTILVVACGEAARSEVARATRTILQSGARVPGIVLTKVAPGLGARRSYTEYSSQRPAGDLRGLGERRGNELERAR